MASLRFRLLAPGRPCWPVMPGCSHFGAAACRPACPSCHHHQNTGAEVCGQVCLVRGMSAHSITPCTCARSGGRSHPCAQYTCVQAGQTLVQTTTHVRPVTDQASSLLGTLPKLCSDRCFCVHAGSQSRQGPAGLQTAPAPKATSPQPREAPTPHRPAQQVACRHPSHCLTVRVCHARAGHMPAPYMM